MNISIRIWIRKVSFLFIFSKLEIVEEKKIENEEKTNPGENQNMKDLMK